MSPVFFKLSLLSLKNITRGFLTVFAGQKMALVDSDPLKCQQRFENWFQFLRFSYLREIFVKFKAF